MNNIKVIRGKDSNEHSAKYESSCGNGYTKRFLLRVPVNMKREDVQEWALARYEFDGNSTTWSSWVQVTRTRQVKRREWEIFVRCFQDV